MFSFLRACFPLAVVYALGVRGWFRGETKGLDMARINANESAKNIVDAAERSGFRITRLIESSGVMTIERRLMIVPARAPTCAGGFSAAVPIGERRW